MTAFRTSRQANFHSNHRTLTQGYREGQKGDWGHKVTHLRDLEHLRSGTERNGFIRYQKKGESCNNRLVEGLQGRHALVSTTNNVFVSVAQVLTPSTSGCV